MWSLSSLAIPYEATVLSPSRTCRPLQSLKWPAWIPVLFLIMSFSSRTVVVRLTESIVTVLSGSLATPRFGRTMTCSWNTVGGGGGGHSWRLSCSQERRSKAVPWRRVSFAAVTAQVMAINPRLVLTDIHPRVVAVRCGITYSSCVVAGRCVIALSSIA